LLKNLLTYISKDTINLIHHCRNSILFCNGKPWVKKSGSHFDVAMGSFEGAEICELVDLFLLNCISESSCKTDHGLYKDDGLSGPECEKIREKIIKIFQEQGPQISSEISLTQTDYMDVTLDLKSNRFWPF